MKFVPVETEKYPILTYKDIKQNKCYRCIHSPSGHYENWILVGVDYKGVDYKQELFGIWIEYINSKFSTLTCNFEHFEFVEIQAELREI